MQGEQSIKTTVQISSAAAKKQGMPVLPDGWYYELHAFDSNVLHVVWPEHGAASVHFKHRTVAAGWTIPRPAARNAALKSGKGWKAALVSEAVSLLKTG